MHKRFTCQKGHEWDVPVDRRLATAVECIACPVCGSPAETLPPGASPHQGKSDASPSQPAGDDTVNGLHSGGNAGVDTARSQLATPPGGPRHAQTVAPRNSRPGAGALGPASQPNPKSPGESPSPQAKSAPSGGSADFGLAPIPEQFGRYRIIKTLGRGGMGAVYLAHDTQLHREVAMKIPHLTQADGPEALERFYRESRAAATLDHPNICPVHDVGQIDGVHYLVMAYIDGKPLSEFIRPGTPLPPGESWRRICGDS